MKAQSNAEIDQLGEALKHAPVSEASLIALDQFRLTFRPAINHVRQALNTHCAVQCSLRPSKSTPSIVAKLIRQPTLRLTQIQDIAGLRVIVKGYAEQDALRNNVVALYPNCKVFDRREKPSFGYRAVHLVLKIEGRLVELQIRTEFQHAWGQASEKIADSFGHMTKYMESDNPQVVELTSMSAAIHVYECVRQRFEVPTELDTSVVEQVNLHLDKLELLKTQAILALQKAYSLN